MEHRKTTIWPSRGRLIRPAAWLHPESDQENPGGSGRSIICGHTSLGINQQCFQSLSQSRPPFFVRLNTEQVRATRLPSVICSQSFLEHDRVRINFQKIGNGWLLALLTVQNVNL